MAPSRAATLRANAAQSPSARGAAWQRAARRMRSALAYCTVAAAAWRKMPVRIGQARLRVAGAGAAQGRAQGCVHRTFSGAAGRGTSLAAAVWSTQILGNRAMKTKMSVGGTCPRVGAAMRARRCEWSGGLREVAS